MVVVLPTPPFWLDTVITRVSFGRGKRRPAKAIRRRVSSATSSASGVESSIKEIDSINGCDPEDAGKRVLLDAAAASAARCACRKPGAGSISSQGRVTDTEMVGASVSVEGGSFDVDIRTSGRPVEKTRKSASAREPRASAVAYWRSGTVPASSSSSRSTSTAALAKAGLVGAELVVELVGAELARVELAGAGRTDSWRAATGASCGEASNRGVESGGVEGGGVNTGSATQKPSVDSPGAIPLDLVSLGPMVLGPMMLGPTSLGPTSLGPTSLGPTLLGSVSREVISLGVVSTSGTPPPFSLDPISLVRASTDCASTTSIEEFGTEAATGVGPVLV